MSTLIKEVDARTRLAGANQMELLLFHAGTSEVFGVNVFKVREVMKLPALTRMPDSDPRIEGMVNIRGVTVPVIGLRQTLGLGEAVTAEAGSPDAGILIITEYNMSLQAFHVAAVDRIIRISWSEVKPPPALVRDTAKGGVTAVTMLDDGRMALILDVEKILADICPRSDEEVYAPVEKQTLLTAKRVLFADDSLVARTQIRKTLERLGVSYLQATTGREAWDQLRALADKAEAEHKTVREELQLILSDIEMPDMDGFTLSKQISGDPRFAGIPILLHSSLTGVCNVEKGKSVGATDYITKFDPKILAEKILHYVGK
ncbi:MAG: chemotaxis protein CheV [Nitrospirae bacterium]|nr:chemotaxis protein CheV [Nitrospirota bacterium]